MTLIARYEAYISRSGDFRAITTTTTTDGQTDCFTPCTCALGNNYDSCPSVSQWEVSGNGLTQGAISLAVEL